jgi:hypothetical protein
MLEGILDVLVSKTYDYNRLIYLFRGWDHVIRIPEMQNMYRMSVWNFELMVPRVRSKIRLEDNIKIDHNITECQDVDRNESAQDRVKW